MKTFVRIVALLAISVALGLAVYAIVQPVAPAATLAQGGPGGSGGQGGPGVQRGGGRDGGHPQVSFLGQIGPVLLKFGAIFIAVAGVRGFVARRRPRERAAAAGGSAAR